MAHRHRHHGRVDNHAEALQQARRTVTVLVGIDRIGIELEGNPEAISKYAKKYLNLVETIVAEIKGKIPGSVRWLQDTAKLTEEKAEQLSLILTMKVIRSKVGSGNTENHFLSESLETNKWDCDASSSLVFDVVQKLGIPIKFIVTSGHALVATDNFVFDPYEGIRPIRHLFEHYPYYTLLVKPEEIKSVAYYTRGYWHNDNREYDDAIKDFTLAIRSNPKFTDPYYFRGIIYTEVGDYTKAIDDFTKVIMLNPHYIAVYVSRGNVYSMVGEFGQAMADYTKAIETIELNQRGIKSGVDDYRSSFEARMYSNLQLAIAYNGRGNAYSLIGNYDMAIKDYDEAIKLDSQNAKAYYHNRGNEYVRIKEYNKAMKDYESILRLDPEDVNAARMLSALRAAQE